MNTREVAARIRALTRVVVAYSLEEKPRLARDAPTTIEVALSHLTDFAQELELSDPACETLVSVMEGDGFRTIDSVVDDVVQLAMQHHEGNVSAVARALGMGRSTLYRVLRKLPDEVRKAERSSAWQSRPAAISGPDLPKRVLHLKRGTTYRVERTVCLQASSPVSEGDVLVVYIPENDGRGYARPESEFRDGRFASLPPLDAEVPPLEGRGEYQNKFMLLASYCGVDAADNFCTDDRPCDVCLAMCNIFDASGKYAGTLATDPDEVRMASTAPHAPKGDES